MEGRTPCGSYSGKIKAGTRTLSCTVEATFNFTEVFADDVTQIVVPRQDLPVNRDGIWTGTVEVVSWNPRAFVYKSFLTDEECDYMIEHVSLTFAIFIEAITRPEGKLWCWLFCSLSAVSAGSGKDEKIHSC